MSNKSREREIFLAALEIEDEEKQQNFLHQECAGNEALLLRIESLLNSAPKAVEFLGEKHKGLALTLVAGESEEFIKPDQFEFLVPSDKAGCMGLLDHYEILGLLGRGAFGIVFRAYDTKLNRVVAIKVLAPEFANNPMAVRRFLREAQAAAAVSHDHVVTLHSIEQVSQPPYIVMEYVEGESLKERIDREGPFEVLEILRIGMQIAGGLNAAHQQGLVHRDIKPANILLENGIKRVKLTDFGLARAVDDIGMTTTGTIAGTPQYMSPEQGLGKPVDERSDLFSLGSVLYELCAGRSPFRADSTIATLKRVCDDSPRSIREINNDIPTWLEKLVLQLLEKDPANRPQSASEIEETLRECLAHLQSEKSGEVPPCLIRSNGDGGITTSNAPQNFLAIFHIGLWLQAIFMSIALIAASIDVHLIVPAGFLLGVLLGPAVGTAGYFANRSWLETLCPFSLPVFALILASVINVFRLSPSEPASVLVLLYLYAAIAIPWCIASILRVSRDENLATSARVFPALLGSILPDTYLLTIVLFQLVGISLTAAVMPMSDGLATAFCIFFFVLVGTVLSFVCLYQRRRIAICLFGFSAPAFIPLLVLSVTGFGLTSVDNSKVVVMSLMTTFAYIVVPFGFVALIRELDVFGNGSATQFGIKAALMVTTALGFSFAVARPAIGFGTVAFLASGLFVLTLIGVTVVCGAHLYNRENHRWRPILWFSLTSACLAVALLFSLSVWGIEEQVNRGDLEVDIPSLKGTMQNPVWLNVEWQNGRKESFELSVSHKVFPKIKAGKVKLSLSDERYQLPTTDFEIRRASVVTLALQANGPNP
ncbi:MAG: serine/threonine-protein kinase [Planctomycetota bacterium]